MWTTRATTGSLPSRALRACRGAAPTKGLVTLTLDLDASQSYAPGDIAFHVIDEPTNRWLNRDNVVSTLAGSYDAVFRARARAPLPSPRPARSR
jgi:hypothetical protein